MAGFGVAQCSDGATRPARNASTAFSSPAMPLAASRWPMLVLTDPMVSGRDRRAPSASPSAAASIGSPAGVPVPCAST